MKKLYQVTCVIVIFSVSAIIENPFSTTLAHEIPKAECISNAFGDIKCGYNCVQNNFGDIGCSNWAGGACKTNSFSDIVCGPPAPPNWLSSYTNKSNGTGIYGAWAVQKGKWNGILRMQGNSGRMILTTNTGASVEQKMTLKANSANGYILDGEVIASYIRGKYYADNFYIQQFSTGSMSIKNCSDNQSCHFVTLVYLGK